VAKRRRRVSDHVFDTPQIDRWGLPIYSMRCCRRRNLQGVGDGREVDELLRGQRVVVNEGFSGDRVPISVVISVAMVEIYKIK
jgi:hypothetical protein